MARAAVASAVACAIGGTFGARFVDASLVPGTFAALRVQVANTCLTARVVTLRSGMSGATVAARCGNGCRRRGRQRSARTAGLALITRAHHARGVPNGLATHRIHSAYASRASADVATRPVVNGAAVAAGRGSRRDTGTLPRTATRVIGRGHADSVPPQRLATRDIEIANTGGTGAIVAAGSGMLAAAVAAEGRGWALSEDRSAARTDRQECDRDGESNASLRHPSHRCHLLFSFRHQESFRSAWKLSTLPRLKLQLADSGAVERSATMQDSPATARPYRQKKGAKSGIRLGPSFTRNSVG
jgi:hypothetical protein